MSTPIFIVSGQFTEEVRNGIAKVVQGKIGDEYHCFIVQTQGELKFEMFSEKLIDPIELERLKELVTPQQNETTN